MINGGHDPANARGRCRYHHPDHAGDDTFRALLDATEALARTGGKQKVTMAVNARHTWALERLLKWGYRVERMAVHMVLKGTDDGPCTDGCMDLSRWAGCNLWGHDL